MSGSVLLDTNIVIALFANDEEVKQQLAQAESVYLPVIVLGELYYGAQNSSQVDKNLQRVQSFAKSSAILLCDAGTAQEYGRVKRGLKQKGRPIPENDVWIAALAIQHDLTLVTRDAHFIVVDGLRQESW